MARILSTQGFASHRGKGRSASGRGPQASSFLSIASPIGGVIEAGCGCTKSLISASLQTIFDNRSRYSTLTKLCSAATRASSLPQKGNLKSHSNYRQLLGYASEQKSRSDRPRKLASNPTKQPAALLSRFFA